MKGKTMEQIKWLLENRKLLEKKIKGFYKIVEYNYSHSSACTIVVWVKTYEKINEGVYDDGDEDREYVILFEPDGKIREMKEI
jgi:hypothetical protein